MFISTAYAQAAGGAPGLLDGGLVSLLPLVLIFVVFYFLLIRPQQKKVKEHRAMVQALRRGDRVVTSGGVIGQVTKVLSDTELQVEIAEGVRVRVLRTAVNEVLSKTAPADTRANDDDEKAAEKKSGN
jgi:preprotein translocase subunit YajC